MWHATKWTVNDKTSTNDAAGSFVQRLFSLSGELGRGAFFVNSVVICVVLALLTALMGSVVEIDYQSASKVQELSKHPILLFVWCALTYLLLLLVMGLTLLQYFFLFGVLGTLGSVLGVFGNPLVTQVFKNPIASSVVFLFYSLMLLVCAYVVLGSIIKRIAHIRGTTAGSGRTAGIFCIRYIQNTILLFFQTRTSK